jgi:alcohol dehydrogenase (cytochrome c)
VSAWGSRRVDELFELIKTSMPPGAEGSLSAQEYLNIVAYILQTNGHSVGAQELRANSARVIGSAASVARSQARGQRTEEAGGGEPSTATPAFANKEIANFTPVTDDVLRNPPQGEWLMWRRTLNGQGYSALNQITRANVHELRLAWMWAMTDGANEVTPLVHDGVMYLANPGNVIQALDAKTGDIIWEYRRRFPAGVHLLPGVPGTSPCTRTRYLSRHLTLRSSHSRRARGSWSGRLRKPTPRRGLPRRVAR